VTAGSARRCVSETTYDGEVCGCRSIRTPYFFPLTMNGVTPTTVPSTGE
jgi:hypothetical protein